MMHRRANSGDTSQRRYVRASDRRLAEVVAQASNRIDWDALKQRHIQGVGLTTERMLDGTVVSATKVLECSMAEINSLLIPDTSERYACAMRELLGKDFIYGAIVHHATEITTQDVTVKTVTLMKRHILARSEQWCYVSATKALDPSGNVNKGYSVTVASLHPDDVFIGKAQASSVIHLQGLSSAYYVTPEKLTMEEKQNKMRPKRKVRVTFSAHVAKVSNPSKPSRLRWLLTSIRGRDEVDDASNSVVLTRATQQAQMLELLGTVVRRRRIEAQVLANVRRVQPTNARCVSCTRRVDSGRSLFGSTVKNSPKGAEEETTASGGSRQCEICGFMVCSRCVCTIDRRSLSWQSGESSNKSANSPRMVHLCEHCMQRVDDADYDNFSAGGDSVSSFGRAATPIQADAPNAEPASAVIARALSSVLGDATPDEKPVVIRVIKHLLSPQKRIETKFRADQVELSKNLKDLVPEESVESNQDDGANWDEVNRGGPESPEDESTPRLAGATGRSYPLRYQDVTSDDEAPADLPGHPVPADESFRLGWISSHPNIVCNIMNHPELELLCNVARGELKCDAVLVTIIGPDASYVVASTDPGWRGAAIPRDHSICAHTLMSRAPLLVPHPEADVRFSAMNLVRRDGVRFYLGFPMLISYPAGGMTAVGTFCCVHAGESRTVSQSQYALMTTLAEGAMRVMETHAALLEQN